MTTKGIPYAEPSFASVAAFTPNTTSMLTTGFSNKHTPVQPAHGISFSHQPINRQLVFSEGGGVAYNEIEVEAKVIRTEGEEDTPTPLVARTLQAKSPWTPNGAPSAQSFVCYDSNPQLRNTSLLYRPSFRTVARNLTCQRSIAHTSTRSRLMSSLFR
jgi:hypothetical protein